MSANLHNAAGAGPRASRLGFAGAIAALLLATGCWEEVRYAGGPEPQRRPRSDAPAPAGPPTSTEPAEDRLIADDPSDEALPAADDLFDAPAVEPAADDAPGPPPEVITLSPPPRPGGERPPAVDSEPPAPATSASPVTPRQRLDAWTAASSWSLGVAASARGLDDERSAPMFAAAAQAAAALEVELPRWSTAAALPEERVAAAQSALRTDGVELSRALEQRLDEPAGAAARLAIGSHLLLLEYDPRGSGPLGAARSLAAAGRASQLPPALWQPLVDLASERAPFADVRSAVFALHKAVAAHLEAPATDADPASAAAPR